MCVVSYLRNSLSIRYSILVVAGYVVAGYIVAGHMVADYIVEQQQCLPMQSRDINDAKIYVLLPTVGMTALTTKTAQMPSHIGMIHELKPFESVSCVG